MRITMVGTGYVGLVSGACFADFGHQVTCVDKNADKIAALQRGEIPIFEPDLDRLVETNVRAGRLTFSTELTEPVSNSEAVFIAVGTPSRRGDGHADLSYVYAAAREIAAGLKGFTVVITKSTVPVGTGDESVCKGCAAFLDCVLVLWFYHQPIVGGSGGTTTFIPEMLNRLLHTKFKIVKGYRSTGDILLAMERGEVPRIDRHRARQPQSRLSGGRPSRQHLISSSRWALFATRKSAGT